MSFSYSNYVTGLAKNASLRDLFLCRVIILYTQFYIKEKDFLKQDICL